MSNFSILFLYFFNFYLFKPLIIFEKRIYNKELHKTENSAHGQNIGVDDLSFDFNWFE